MTMQSLESGLPAWHHLPERKIYALANLRRSRKRHLHSLLWLLWFFLEGTLKSVHSISFLCCNLQPPAISFIHCDLQALLRLSIHPIFSPFCPRIKDCGVFEKSSIAHFCLYLSDLIALLLKVSRWCGPREDEKCSAITQPCPDWWHNLWSCSDICLAIEYLSALFDFEEFNTSTGS